MNHEAIRREEAALREKLYRVWHYAARQRAIFTDEELAELKQRALRKMPAPSAQMYETMNPRTSFALFAVCMDQLRLEV